MCAEEENRIEFGIAWGKYYLRLIKGAFLEQLGRNEFHVNFPHYWPIPGEFLD
jgi:hypothetical protein